MNKRTVLATALALSLCATQAFAAELVPVILDGADEGYNDPAPAAPVGGNPGTSIGEQRRIVAQFAAKLWGAVLVSPEPVFIAAQFNPLAPNVLGSAGSVTVHANFPGAPVAGTWYSAALADSYAAADLSPTTFDISSQFSSTFTFYYGLDGNTPAGQVNFLDVVMHEYGHGLGFQNFENEANGTFLSGVPDIYSTFTFDNSTGKFWTEMTVAERQASAINYGKVVFTGSSAAAGAALTLGPRTALRIFSPAAIAGDLDFGTASFGAPATPANFTGSVVVGTDAAEPLSVTTTDGCSPLDNAAAVAGKIVLVDRGSCGFVVKAKNVQNAGGIGMLLADNVAASPAGMSGADLSVTIPSLRITLGDGNAIKGQLASTTVQVGLVVDASKLQGADDLGRPRLFMPNPVVGGSSGSHYDTALLPNALMEPSINSTLFSAYNIDISANLLRDTGWRINEGNAKIGGCDTTIDVVDEAGIIIGANVEATSALCKASTPSKAAYQMCMDSYKTGLETSGLITGKQGGKMMACAAKLK